MDIIVFIFISVSAGWSEKKSTCDETAAATCAHAQVLSSTLTAKTADGCTRRGLPLKKKTMRTTTTAVWSRVSRGLCSASVVGSPCMDVRQRRRRQHWRRAGEFACAAPAVCANKYCTYIWMCGYYRVYISWSAAQYITSCTLMVHIFIHIVTYCRRRPPARQIWWWSTGAGSCHRKLYYVLLFFVCNNIL